MAVPPEAFGERLKALQREAGLTNEQLARRIGTGLRNVQRWRATEVAPRLDALIELADALDVTLDELVGREAPATRGVAGGRRLDPLDLAEEEADLSLGPDPGAPHHRTEDASAGSERPGRRRAGGSM